MAEPNDPLGTLKQPPIPTPKADGAPVGTARVGQTERVTPGASNPPITTTINDAPDIPGYSITGEIARGGMGRILVGRELALDREVAIKLLLPRADATRFIVEACLTARLPHPSIPPVYALGTLNDGSPYLVMKYVQGRTLAEELQLRPHPLHDLPRWIQVFEQICQAMGFAHAQNIIHRDLKPANIMVGAFGEVQVMDWGLAKELNKTKRQTAQPTAATPPLAEPPFHTRLPTSDLTQQGAVMGTPSYMAPEQARGETADTRADVFALGGILLTILTDQPVFQGSSLWDLLDDAAAGKTAPALERLAACRADEELKALVRRCLAVQAVDRPANGHEVAAMVAAYRSRVEERFRQAEKDRAIAETQAKENRQRRKLTVRWAALIVLVMFAGLSASLWQMNRALDAEHSAIKDRDEKENQRKLAKENEAQAQRERDHAQRERAVAVAVRDFLQNNVIRQANVWEQANTQRLQGGPSNSVKHDVTVRELLDRAARAFAPERIETRFPKQPYVQAEVLETIGETYEAIGDVKQSIHFVRAGLTIREKALGELHPDTLAATINLAFVHLTARKEAEAIALFLQVMGRLDKLSPQASTEGVNRPLSRLSQDPEPFDAAVDAVIHAVKRRCDLQRFGLPIVSFGLADGAMTLLRVGQALPRLKQLAELTEQRYGPRDQRTLFVRLILGFAYHALGQLDQAVHIYEQSYQDAREILSTDDLLMVGLREVLVVTYEAQGRHRERIMEYCELNVQSLQRLLGPLHPATLTVMDHLGDAYLHEGRMVQCIATYEQCLEHCRQVMGPEHTETMKTMNNLAVAYQRAGQLPKALPLFQQVHEFDLKKYGLDHQNTLLSMQSLAQSYSEWGDHEKAIAMSVRVHTLWEKKMGAEHQYTLSSLANLAEAYQQAGQPSRSIPMLEKLLELEIKKWGWDHPQSIFCVNQLAAGYEQAGALQQALDLLEKLHGRLQQKYPNSKEHAHWYTLHSLASAYRASGQIDRAIELYQALCERLTHAFGPDHPDLSAVLNNLAGAYRMAGQTQKAVELLQQVYERKQTRLGLEHPSTLITHCNLAVALLQAGQVQEAIAILEPALSKLQTLFGPDHPEVLNVHDELAQAYEAAGRVPEALALYATACQRMADRHFSHAYARRLLANACHAYQTAKKYKEAETWWRLWHAHVQKHADADAPALAWAQAELAHNLLLQQRWQEALTLLQMAVPILQKKSADPWVAYEAQTRLGEAYLRLQKPAEAEKWLVACCTAMMKGQQPRNPQKQRLILHTVDLLLELYQQWPKPGEVEKWRKIKEQLNTKL